MQNDLTRRWFLAATPCAGLALSLLPSVAVSRQLSPKIAGLGDSITEQGALRIGQNSTPANGYLSYIPVLTQQRVRYDTSMNFGVSSQMSDMIAARVSDVIAARPAVCVVLAGNNDFASTYLPSETIENLGRIYDSLLAAGIKVIALPVLPFPVHETHNERMSWFFRARRDRWMGEVNTWIAKQQARDGLFFCDVTPSLVDSDGEPLAGVYWEGIHPSELGSFLIASKIASVINEIYPNPRTLVRGKNLLPNGSFSGSGGGMQSVSGGTLASHWFASGAALPVGVSTFFWKGTLRDGTPAQAVTISGEYEKSDGAYIDLATMTPVNPGDTVEAQVAIEVDTGSESVFHPELYIYSHGVKNVFNADLFADARNTPPSEPIRGVYRTQPLVVPDGAASAGLTIRVKLRDTSTPRRAAATIRFATASLDRVG